jgi:hypothetical protein
VPTVSLGGNGILIAGSVPNGYTMQWLLNNFAISGQTNDTLNALMTGVYKVEIVDSFGCVHTSAPFNVNLGLTENSFISWNVYPNPADGYVTVEVSDDVQYEPETESQVVATEPPIISIGRGKRIDALRTVREESK